MPRVPLKLLGFLFASAFSPALAQLAPGAPFDAAPFGWLSRDEAARSLEVRWAEPRKIAEVVAEFDPPAEPADLKLRYWRATWDGRSDPALSEADAGAAGWAAMHDWTNGSWVDADCAARREGNSLRFLLEPSGRREFPGLGSPGVRYRKTLKVRVAAPPSSALPARLRAFTQSACRPLGIRIQFGEGSDGGKPPENETVKFGVHNGALLSARAVEGSGAAAGPFGEARSCEWISDSPAASCAAAASLWRDTSRC